MKRTVTLSAIILLIITSAMAQIQSGIVKTRGRMIDGKYVQGKGLPGAIVAIKDRMDIGVKNSDGSFSFPARGKQFMVQSVTKKEYTLVDADAVPKTYLHSADTLFLVMERPDQLLQDELASQKRIRRTLQRQLEEREDEIEALKAENKITQEEYRQALQKLYADQENNEKLISEMAKRFSQLDYDRMDGFYRQVSHYIEQGELTKADSMLRSRGNLSKQIEAHLRTGETIQQKEKELKQAKAVYRHDNKELAQRCYSYYENFKMHHQNDSAAKYIEMRATLDTTNLEWLSEAADFIVTYLARYSDALKYYEAGLRHAIAQHGMESDSSALFYNNIGFTYSNQGDYSKALEYYQKALNIQEKIFGTEHPDVARSYNNIGFIYSNQGDYSKALEYDQKALNIREKIFGTEHPDVATSYNNIGIIYYSQGDYNMALEYYQKALNILEKIFGKEHQHYILVKENIEFIKQKVK